MHRLLAIAIGAAVTFIVVYLLGRDVFAATMAAFIAAVFVAVAGMIGAPLLAYLTIAVTLLLAFCCAANDYDADDSLKLITITLVIIAVGWTAIALVNGVGYWMR